MKFLDINTFYCPKGGGIRTYHQAKLEYFKSHPEHSYCLVCPGAGRKTSKAAPNVSIEEVYGPALTKDPKGYRLMLDYWAVYFLIRKMKPDVIEAGDPWLTGLFTLLFARSRGAVRSSFYHADPVDTYFSPWAARPGPLQALRRHCAGAGAAIFYLLQRRYSTTITTSKTMWEKLTGKEVPGVVCMPFGVNPVFFEAGKKRSAGKLNAREGPVKLLYAGRFDTDKDIGLLLEAVPHIVKDEGISFTFAGRGKYAAEIEKVKHPSITCLGYISDPEELAKLFLKHDVFIATGPHETFGLAVLEALAAGLVVVGPDRGGSAEVLQDTGTGFIFESGSVKSLLEQICRARAGDFTREIPRALQAAQKYGSWNTAIQRMVGYYAEIHTASTPIHPMRGVS